MQNNGLKWLHHSSVVIDEYDPSLLQPIKRSSSRDTLTHLDFFGEDIWQAFEVSFIQSSGVPQVATLSFNLNAKSEYVVESKSLKLYLNSLNNHVFKNEEALSDTICKDLKPILGSNFEVFIHLPPFPSKIETLPLHDWQSLDGLQSNRISYNAIPNENELHVLKSDGEVTEKLYTQLFRANCLVTNQPDWATLMIEYSGQPWDKISLMNYLISYRNHQSFHEQCVDRIFSDITKMLNPKSLFIQANFMRRGGIDITPVRSSHEKFSIIPGRDWRQ